LTPEERSARSRIAAHTLHSKYDSKVLTAPGRRAFLERFEREVDPNGLPEKERWSLTSTAIFGDHLSRRSVIANTSANGALNMPERLTSLGWAI
jgi:hypothetical protein